MFLNRAILFLLIFFNINILFSQNIKSDFYREDQIYISLYYNSLKNDVSDLKENKFSSSINFGFIRDIPLNKSGKFAIGLGIGFGFNTYNNNLKINYQSSNNFFSGEYLENQIEYDYNRFNLNEIQFPIEIRFRNSSIDNYKFWRLYAGLKYSKAISRKYKFENLDSNYTLNNIPINSDQLGLTLNIGFNTWNIGLYKAIKPFFSGNQHNLSLDLEQFKVGLVFYIL